MSGASLDWPHILSAILVILSAVTSLLMGLSLLILRAVWGRLNTINEKLESKISLSDCHRESSACSSRFAREICALWEAIKEHSHTGLQSDSKVTR